MKNLICLFISVFHFVVISQAQVTQGKVLLGASTPIMGGFEGVLLAPRNGAGLNFTTYTYSFGSNESKTKSTTIDFSPSVGYVVTDNLLLALRVSVFSQTTKDKDGSSDDKSNATLLSVGPELRYYFPLGKVQPFVVARGEIGTLKNKYEGSSFNDESTGSLSTIAGGAGVALFINEALSVDFTLLYQSLTAKDKDDDDTKEQQAGAGLNVGFSWFLR